MRYYAYCTWLQTKPSTVYCIECKIRYCHLKTIFTLCNYITLSLQLFLWKTLHTLSWEGSWLQFFRNSFALQLRYNVVHGPCWIRRQRMARYVRRGRWNCYQLLYIICTVHIAHNMRKYYLQLWSFFVLNTLVQCFYVISIPRFKHTKCVFQRDAKHITSIPIENYRKLPR